MVLCRARAHLAAGEERALQDQEDAKARFRRWAAQRVPDAEHMNICSGPQARPLHLTALDGDLRSDAPTKLEAPMNIWM